MTSQSHATAFLQPRDAEPTDEWYTPPWLFERLGLEFDLDAAAPTGGLPWVPAARWIDYRMNGLLEPWAGSVWLNPPYSLVGPFTRKLAAHGRGVALIYARTDTGWFQHALAEATAACFVRSRIPFLRPDGSVGDRPGIGSALLAYGAAEAAALEQADLGLVLPAGWSRPRAGGLGL